MPRLPQPGADNGNWGDILNDYLSQSLAADGAIKDNAVTSNTLAPNSVTNAALASDSVTASIIVDGSITETLLDSDVRTKLNAPVVLTDGSVTKTKLATSVQATLEKADTALQSAPVTSVNSRSGDVTITKADVGLANADSTSDIDKPVSTATQTALDAKVTKVAATNNAVVRFDGTTGSVKNSGVTIDDSSTVAIPNNLSVNTNLFVTDTATGRVSIGSTQFDSKLKVSATNSDVALNVSSNGGRIMQAQANGTTKFFIDALGFFRIGSLATQPAGVIHVDMPTAGNLSDSMIGLTIRGRAAQTGDLLQLQDANANVLFSVDAAGKAKMTGTPTNAAHVTSKDYVDTTIATKMTNATGFVNHGAVAATARPVGFVSVTWLGSVQPVNMTANDFWVES